MDISKQEILDAIVKRLVRHEEKTTEEFCPFIGKKVLIRTNSAGVHVGTLKAKEGQSVILENTRRIYNWSGAFTLSAVANDGIKGGKVTAEQPIIQLEQVIETHPTTEKAQASFKTHEHKI